MGVFQYEKVKDPTYYGENRVPAHSDHRYYGSVEEMEQHVENFRHSLNGLWKFHYAKNYESTIPGFETPEYDCTKWDDIRVPAHIQMEGYDAPQYANVQYPWEGREEIQPGEIPERFNPTASYVKYFEVPDQMKGKRLFVSFQGAESGIAVWLNGTFLGYSEDTFTPSEFELTPYLKEGENKLAAQVFKWTSGSWCEDQDFFRFSGIYRDVYLYTIPEVHVSDLKVQTLLDDTFTKADLVIDTKTIGKGKVKITLSKDGTALQSTEGVLDGETQFVLKVDHPELWSAETPVLYDLLLEVTAEDGTVQELIPQRVGFRRFEMKDHIMMLNGKRIVFKGVNRHEFSSVSGRVVSREELIKDLTTMKQNNINAIRTCHYPDASLIYQLCDEYGIYMIDETNLESHGSWDVAEFTKDYTYVVPHDKPEWLDMMLDRANSMYQRDKNHAAILIWSCGNESFGGKDIFEMSQFFHKEDPTRLVHYEGLCHDRRYNDTSDMESQMYTKVAQIKEFLSKYREKPFICCEYTHSMGNSNGGMHKYTDLTDEEPLYQGGFIWDFADQAIWTRDLYGNDVMNYGGDFGDRSCDYNFSGNGIVFADHAPTSKLQEVKFNYQNFTLVPSETGVKIINKSLFTNTSDYDLIIALAKNGKNVWQKKLTADINAGQTGEVAYTLPTFGAGEYVVTASLVLKQATIWANCGHEVAFGQYVFTKEGKADKKAVAPIKVVKSDFNIGVKGEGFSVMFSADRKMLTSYKYNGVELIEEFPKMNFWRAPIDNDNGCGMPFDTAQWKLASMYTKCVDMQVSENGTESATVKYTYELATRPVAHVVVTYTVTGDGVVKVDMDYKKVEGLPAIPDFGMLFTLPVDYDQIKYYGLGPCDNYIDRKEGGKLGIFTTTTQDEIQPYLVPQECGNHCDVRWFEVTDRRGRGVRISSATPFEASALPYNPHEIENARHHYDLARPHHTVLRASAGMYGVGGDDSWGAPTLDEYITKNEDKHFSFEFKGI